MSPTPWWFTVVLALVAAALTHLLTSQRDRNKADRDWMDKWEKAFRDQARKVTDMAINHYISPDSVGKTQVSAALIINEMKRLQSMLGETTAGNQGEAQATQKAFRDFNDAVTSELDFQDPQRAPRPHNDPLLDRIQANEAGLLRKGCRNRRKA